MAIFNAAREAAPVRELDLADLLRARDPAAWRELFEAEHPFVFRAVLAQVRDVPAAEDIAGQVFLEAVEGIGRYRDRGRPMRAWLLAIARHRALDWLRRRNREPAASVLEPVASPEAALTGVLGILAELTPEQREVVHLRFVEGYQLEEVAALTSRSTGAVKSLQHRALARLRTILEEARP